MNELLGNGSKLQPHQTEAVERLRTQRKLLLAHDVGLGKTVTAISHIVWLLRTVRESGRQPGLVLWLTEANLLAQTKAEFAKFAPGLRVLTSAEPMFKQTTQKSRAEYADAFGANGPDVLLLSYATRAPETPLYDRFGTLN